jgi:hypothetical protein
MTGAFSAHSFSDMFGQFDRDDEANQRPYRTSLVISKEANMPGQGFFKTLSNLRGIDLPKSDEEKYKVWLKEVMRLRQFYSRS